MIYCDLNTAKDYAEKKMRNAFDQNNLNQKMDFPEVIWKDLGKNTAGYAMHKVNKIYLNTSYLQSKDWQKFLDETPLHELAHVAAYKVYRTAGHDRNWKIMCWKFGLDGNRCHSFATPDNKQTERKAIQTYKVYCNCGCEHEITQIRYRRMQTGTNYICSMCGSRLRFTK